MKGLRLVYQSKVKKVKNVSVVRRMGECYHWKANGQCSRGDSCSFIHGSNLGQRAQSSSLAPQAQTQIDGRKLSKGIGPRGDWKERDPSDRAKTTSVEIARIRRVISGILPDVKITNLSRDANSAISICWDILRLTGSPVKGRRKVAERLCCFIEESNSILRKGTQFLGLKRSVQFSKGASRHMKVLGEKKIDPK